MSWTLVKVNLNFSGLTSGKALTVTATHSGSMTTCSNTTTAESYTLAPSSVVSANATGATQTISFALPYGAWTIAATCNSKSSTATYTWTAASVGANVQTLNQALS